MRRRWPGHAHPLLLAGVVVVGMGASLVQASQGHTPLETAIVGGLLLALLGNSWRVERAQAVRFESLGLQLAELRGLVGDTPISTQVSEAKSAIAARAQEVIGGMDERYEKRWDRMEHDMRDLRDRRSS